MHRQPSDPKSGVICQSDNSENKVYPRRKQTGNDNETDNSVNTNRKLIKSCWCISTATVKFTKARHTLY